MFFCVFEDDYDFLFINMIKEIWLSIVLINGNFRIEIYCYDRVFRFIINKVCWFLKMNVYKFWFFLDNVSCGLCCVFLKNIFNEILLLKMCF